MVKNHKPGTTELNRRFQNKPSGLQCWNPTAQEGSFFLLAFLKAFLMKFCDRTNSVQPECANWNATHHFLLGDLFLISVLHQGFDTEMHPLCHWEGGKNPLSWSRDDEKQRNQRGKETEGFLSLVRAAPYSPWLSKAGPAHTSWHLVPWRNRLAVWQEVLKDSLALDAILALQLTPDFGQSSTGSKAYGKKALSREQWEANRET